MTDFEAQSIIMSFAINHKTKLTRNANGISRHVIVLWIVIGNIQAEIHKIRNTLAILLQRIFQIAISVFHFRLAIMFIASSGDDVQNATIVSQIIKSDIFAFLAMEADQSTNRLAHFIKIKNQSNNSNICIKFFIVF